MKDSMCTTTKNSGGELPLEISAWLDMARVGRVKVTSEDSRYPMGSAFEEGGQGWRAAESGKQTITIFLDKPRRIRRICLRFIELEVKRSQKVSLHWSKGQVKNLQLMVERWCSFDPAGSTGKTLDYKVDLVGVRVLQLVIDPDIWRGRAVASLASFRFA